MGKALKVFGGDADERGREMGKLIQFPVDRMRKDIPVLRETLPEGEVSEKHCTGCRVDLADLKRDILHSIRTLDQRLYFQGGCRRKKDCIRGLLMSLVQGLDRYYPGESKSGCPSSAQAIPITRKRRSR